MLPGPSPRLSRITRIIWGMEKSHYFLYGKEFTLETDQKPLVSIYKKHMIDISPRVQRLIVRSFPYLPFKVVYKKGTDIPVADALSHVTPMDPEDNIQLPITAVNMITTQILMSVESQGSFSNKLYQLRKSTTQDKQLTRLKGYISTGFPCEKKNLLTDVHEFWPHKEMLSIKSGLITCGNRIIVPKETRPEMLQYNPAIPNMVRDSVHKNSQENTSSDPVQLPLPRLDLP